MRPRNPKMALREKPPETIKTSHSSSTSSEYFPMEIVIEILSRLPVESLLRCKSVCKSWRSLISDPHFIKCHLTLSTTNHQYAHHRLLVSRKWYKTYIKICPLYDMMYDHISINPSKLDYPMKHPHDSVSIIGSCNGLICIVVACFLFIWNPTTRKSIKLPDYPRSYGIKSRGFGYKESSDDYKVVEITHSSGTSSSTHGMIYSSKSGKWKEVRGLFHYHFDWPASNVFLNGALHWLAIKDDRSWVIVSLDLAKGTCGEILLPIDKEGDCSLILGTLGDCLCVVYTNRKSSGYLAVVWVMKVYGVKDSWFNLVSIPSHIETLFKGLQGNFSAPLCVSDDGKVLLQCGPRLIVFNSKDDSALEIRKFYGCDQACTFVESLVSPAHRRDQEYWYWFRPVQQKKSRPHRCQACSSLASPRPSINSQSKSGSSFQHQTVLRQSQTSSKSVRSQSLNMPWKS